MGGDQHVRERQQAGEHVVVEDLLAAILEEEIRLLLVDVERERTDPTGLEPVDRRLRVDQRAATGVHQHRAALHRGDGVGVDQVVVWRASAGSSA